MSDRLRVDLAALRGTATELRGLAREFRDAAKKVDDARGAVGHRKVADALEEFAGNWRRHREALVSSLDAVADMAQNSHDTYREADEDLAAEIEKAVR